MLSNVLYPVCICAVLRNWIFLFGRLILCRQLKMCSAVLLLKLGALPVGACETDALLCYVYCVNSIQRHI